MSSLGCCVSLIILVIGLVLTAFTEKKAPPTPQFVRDSSGQYRPTEEKPDGQGEEKPPESGGDWWN